MCYGYEELARLRKEMEKEMQKGNELKKQGKSSAPARPAAPEKGTEERQPVPA
ncbi:MAG TPA: hypothetical protein VMN03_03175 [Burkholderiales bacterium]|jgi:hypothetical protein|nr:hypothetical protein [Burkholderiales bacterium]